MTAALNQVTGPNGEGRISPVTTNGASTGFFPLYGQYLKFDFQTTTQNVANISVGTDTASPTVGTSYFAVNKFETALYKVEREVSTVQSAFAVGTGGTMTCYVLQTTGGVPFRPGEYLSMTNSSNAALNIAASRVNSISDYPSFVSVLNDVQYDWVVVEANTGIGTLPIGADGTLVRNISVSATSADTGGSLFISQVQVTGG